MVLFSILIAFLWFVPQLQGKYFSQDVRPENIPALVNEYRRTWAQLVGGLALIFGLYLTWRRVEIFQQTLETTQDQQVTERFTRAIDQLGATDENGKKLEIRLGGIYALERIARDSVKRDYGTVLEVLTAYVRENAPRQRGIPAWSSTSTPITLEAEDFDNTMTNKPRAPQRAPSDIQAIVDVLARLGKERNQEDNESFNLSSTDLRKISFEDKDLRQAVFNATDFEEAVMVQANLAGVFFEAADFRRTKLFQANFEGAYLDGANFSGADLREANFEGAYLEGAYFKEADLKGTNLEGAFLNRASGLTVKQLEQALGDEHTALPVGFEFPNTWRRDGVMPRKI